MVKLIFGSRPETDFMPLEDAAEALRPAFYSRGLMLDWLETKLRDGTLTPFARYRTEYVNALNFDEELGEEFWLPTHALEPSAIPGGGFYPLGETIDAGGWLPAPRITISKMHLANSRATLDDESRPDRTIVYTELHLLREEVAYYADTTGKVAAPADKPITGRKRGPKGHRWRPNIISHLNKLEAKGKIDADKGQEDAIDILDAWANKPSNGPGLRPSRSLIRNMVKDYFDEKGWRN